MSLLLRVVQGNRWYFADELAVWQERKDLPGAPFGDVRPTASGKLSVWVIEDDQTNLNRIIAGFAASRHTMDPFDARIVSAESVQALGIESEQSRGDSKDQEAKTKWHRDLIRLTYRSLGELVTLLASEGTPIEMDENEVRQLIVESVKVGHIKLDDLKPKPPRLETSVWYAVSEALRAEGHE